MNQIGNNTISIDKVNELNNNSILSNYKEVSCHMSRYGTINISKKDQEIFQKSNDFLIYSNAVFNNKKNKNKFKSIVALEIFKIISIILMLIGIFVSISSVTNKEFDNNIYFLLSTYCLAFIVEIWSSIVYDTRGWFLWGSKNIDGKDKSYISSYFVSEYLKCKYESLKDVKLTNERIEQIKNNFNYAYYNLEKKEIESYKNKANKVSKKWNDNNYIEKTEKIKKILNRNYFFEILLVVFCIILIVMILNIFSIF